LDQFLTMRYNTGHPYNLETQQKVMHHEEIELNFDASRQQILGFELEILWEACSTPTLESSRIRFKLVLFSCSKPKKTLFSD
jgi:hypothetical protein